MLAQNIVARPYAKAVFAHAQEAGELEKWSGMLAVAGQAIADPQVVPLLKHPRVRAGWFIDLLAGLDASLQDPCMRRLLTLLASHKRLTALPAIAQLYEAYRAKANAMRQVTLTVARPMSEANLGQFEQALSQKLGGKVALDCLVDERIIAGAIVQMGDVVINGSVLGQLSRLADALAS